MNSKLFFLCFFTISAELLAQQNDSIVFKSIATYSLTQSTAYKNLEFLCKQVGNRLSGSSQAETAVKWGFELLNSKNFDTVYLQECMVPKWVRGAKEQCFFIDKNKERHQLRALALGRSLATPTNGITAKILMVNSFDELKKIDSTKVNGKVVFVNQHFDDSEIDCFDAYGKAVAARWASPIEVSKKGGIAVVVRSMTNALDTFPHTGAMGVKDGVKILPAVAISTVDADKLEMLLSKDPNGEIYLKTNCQTFPNVVSYNVIAELKGSESPNEIITVGGHLDSWDIGEGAHDDGAGVVQSIQVLETLKALKLKPKKTIRCVLFMNEENGGRGGKKYAEIADIKKESHIIAIESDRGGFSPIGFSFEGNNKITDYIKSKQSLFMPYSIYNFSKKGGGADIEPLLEKSNAAVAELIPDPQRYFDYHHTANDTFEKVNKRELELGAAALTMFVYLAGF